MIISLSIRPWSHLFFIVFLIDVIEGLVRFYSSNKQKVWIGALFPVSGGVYCPALGNDENVSVQLVPRQILEQNWACKSNFECGSRVFLFYKTINVILLHKKMHIFFKSPFFISPIEQSKNTLECFNIQFCIASGLKNYLRRFLQFERLLKYLNSTKSKISDWDVKKKRSHGNRPRLSKWHCLNNSILNSIFDHKIHH